LHAAERFGFKLLIWRVLAHNDVIWIEPDFNRAQKAHPRAQEKGSAS
jgi:hypothetical protein